MSRFLLFLLDDPNERINLARQNETKVRELEVTLNEYKKKTEMPQVKEPLSENRVPESDPALWGDTFSPGWC